METLEQNGAGMKNVNNFDKFRLKYCENLRESQYHISH